MHKKYINMHVSCFPFNLDDSYSENEIDMVTSLSCIICSVLTSLAVLKTVTSGQDGKLSYEVVNVAKECSCSICISLDYLHIYNTVNQV